jgi:hypothetical protein
MAFSAEKTSNLSKWRWCDDAIMYPCSFDLVSISLSGPSNLSLMIA